MKVAIWHEPKARTETRHWEMDGFSVLEVKPGDYPVNLDDRGAVISVDADHVRSEWTNRLLTASSFHEDTTRRPDTLTIQLYQYQLIGAIESGRATLCEGFEIVEKMSWWNWKRYKRIERREVS